MKILSEDFVLPAAESVNIFMSLSILVGSLIVVAFVIGLFLRICLKGKFSVGVFAIFSVFTILLVFVVSLSLFSLNSTSKVDEWNTEVVQLLDKGFDESELEFNNLFSLVESGFVGEVVLVSEDLDIFELKLDGRAASLKELV